MTTGIIPGVTVTPLLHHEPTITLLCPETRDWGMMGAVNTTTKTIERPDVREDTTTSDDTPKFFHYVKKNKIVESAVSGRMVVALCGETFPVTKQAKPGSPVCADCERVYRSLRKK